MRPAKITQHKVYFQHTYLEHIRACHCVIAQQAPAPRSDSHYTALDLHPIPKVPTWASAAATPPVKLPDLDPTAAIQVINVAFRHLFSKWSVLNMACTTAGSE